MARPVGAKNHNGAICAVDACEREAKKRGWCVRHYKRWERTGSPLGRQPKSASERFWAHVVPGPGDCWSWKAFRDPKGYGHFELTTGAPLRLSGACRRYPGRTRP